MKAVGRVVASLLVVVLAAVGGWLGRVRRRLAGRGDDLTAVARAVGVMACAGPPSGRAGAVGWVVPLQRGAVRPAVVVQCAPVRELVVYGPAALHPECLRSVLAGRAAGSGPCVRCALLLGIQGPGQ